MVGSLVIMRRWFASRGFTMAVAILFAAAHAGNLAATAPLAAATAEWGWRTTFMALAALTAGIALLFFLAVRDAPGPDPTPGARSLPAKVSHP